MNFSSFLNIALLLVELKQVVQWKLEEKKKYEKITNKKIVLERNLYNAMPFDSTHLDDKNCGIN